MRTFVLVDYRKDDDLQCPYLQRFAAFSVCLAAFWISVSFNVILFTYLQANLYLQSTRWVITDHWSEANQFPSENLLKNASLPDVFGELRLPPAGCNPSPLPPSHSQNDTQLICILDFYLQTYEYKEEGNLLPILSPSNLGSCAADHVLVKC